MSSSKEMKLVFFIDAIKHVSRYVGIWPVLNVYFTLDVILEARL